MNNEMNRNTEIAAMMPSAAAERVGFFKRSWRTLALGLGLTAVGVIGAQAMDAGADTPDRAPVPAEAPCNPEIDVCVPGLTVPPDVDPVPGNPAPGETIVVSDTNPEKDEEEEPTTTSTTTAPTTSTVPVSSSSTTVVTVPSTTAAPTTSTTTTSPVPVVTTSSVVITVPNTQPPVLEHTK